MKKKFIVLAAFVTLAATSAMANTEIDVNYYITPVIKRSWEMSNFNTIESYTLPSFAGIEGNFNWFFGDRAGIFDIGLNLDTGIHAITGKKQIDSLDEDGLNSSKTDEPYAGMGLFLSVGPALRFTFTDIFSLSLTPGIQLGFDFAGAQAIVNEITESETFFDFSVAGSINAAAKLWILNRTGFHMGLNFGVDVDFPFAGVNGSTWWIGDDRYESFTGGSDGATYYPGMNFRIFIGMAFQLGDRGYDRQFNYAE